jgi:hypothetical protein
MPKKLQMFEDFYVLGSMIALDSLVWLTAKFCQVVWVGSFIADVLQRAAI